MQMEKIREMQTEFCEVCGNYVPAVEVDGDLYCGYEYAIYPDIATIVGQGQTAPLSVSGT